MFPHLWHRYIFLFGLMGLAAGMLFGTVPTSIPQIILAANWLLEKDFAWKWEELKRNKIFWILISLYFLHIFGIIYTENLHRGLDDLRNKLPLLTLPLILFSTKPLSYKELKLLFTFFILGVIASSIVCFLVYEGYTKKVIVDVRQSSIFMSHIRFSLFIAFAIIALVYYTISEKHHPLRAYPLAAVAWLLFVMFKLEMATGFICLILTSMILLLASAFKKSSKIISISFLALSSFCFVFLILQINKSLNMFEKNPLNKYNTPLSKTANGRPYLNDTLYGLAENGYLIGININDTELEQEWSKRSSIPFVGNDKKGNELRFTMLHYLASKGLTKDSVGLAKLNAEDIRNIELGFSNYKYTAQSGLVSRWRELVWEYSDYKRGENPSGHTLTMRLEFWKTGIYVFTNHLLIGVGTGDVQDEFNKAYEETKSKLSPEWRLRCHNQYLAIAVAFGIIGLAVFFGYLFYPAFNQRKDLHYLYWPFFVIALLSFITEDTLETQSGVTFFIFFQSLFLWLSSFNSKKIKTV